MGEFISIIFLIFLFSYFIRRTTNTNGLPKKKSAESINETPIKKCDNCPADKLINSPYYFQYKRVFDLVWDDKKQPQYKIDWLLWSLEKGRELENEGSYILRSIEKKLPYFCEREIEYLNFVDREKPVMKGSVEGMVDLAALYGFHDNQWYHPYKRKYWKKQLKKLAEEGNLEAQGILCSPRARYAFKEHEIEEFKAKYEQNLMQLAKEGNPYAQLAVGKFLFPFLSQESIDYLNKAAKQKLSDACYTLGKMYEIYILTSNKPISEIELQNYKDKAREYYFYGAAANNGIMATWCQIRTGEDFEDGCFGQRDYGQAMRWYKQALENGDETASHKIYGLEKLHPIK